MDTKASWETWVTRLFSAGTVLALVYFVLFVDFSNHGRIWDKLAAHVPALAKIIPPAAGSQATVVTKGGAGLDEVPIVERTLITAEQHPVSAAAQTSTGTAPAAAASAAPAGAKKSAAPHLTRSLTPLNIDDNSQNRIISVPAGQPGQETAQAQSAPAAPPAASEGASGGAIAAKSSYGAASRSEMMGQAAGPVYNLTGKRKK